VTTHLHFGVWVHYLVVIMYDTIVTVISFTYLLKDYFSAITFVCATEYG
jgi:hypothetical protein